jgi:hypothetical protein
MTSEWMTSSMGRELSKLRDFQLAERDDKVTLSGSPSKTNKITVQQKLKAQALDALNADDSHSDVRPSDSRSAGNKTKVTFAAPSTLPKFPPVPPREEVPQDRLAPQAVTDDKALTLLRKLAEENLSAEEVEAAAGPQS